MTYSIEPVDITEPEIESQLLVLYRAAFGPATLTTPGALHCNTDIRSTGGRLFLAAVENGEIIGANGFLWMEGMRNGRKISFLQSCWTATAPAHQGKRVFPNLMNRAKEIGREGGAAFLCGVANDNSRPIMSQKLGFAERRTMSLQIPAIGFWVKRSLASPLPERHKSDDVYWIDEEQILNQKMREAPEEVRVFRKGGSFLWGKLRRKEKWGLVLPYFDIGGVRLEDNASLSALLMQANKELRVAYIQLAIAEGHPLQQALHGWKPARMNGFMFFNLSDEPLGDVAMMMGTIDVF